jgi:ribonuclease BN (tRNA processing enzyme)
MRIEPLDGRNPLECGPELAIVFLGVGSAFAQKHHQTNLLITKGDSHVLVDFGMTGPAALSAIGLKPTDIRCVLPTHSHADHVGGLECLALMNRYVGMRFMDHPKIKCVIGQEYQRVLWDRTLRGGLEWNEKDMEHGQILSFSDFFDVVRPKWKTHQPREIFEVDLDGIHIEMFRTNHIPEQECAWEACFLAFGLLIDGKVFFSGDTKFDPPLLEHYMLAYMPEVIFHDVQFFKGAVHPYIEDLRGLDKMYRERMHLVHYGDDWEKQDASDFAGWTQQGVRYVFD